MATAIAITALLAAAALGGWAALRLVALIRELMRMTSGLTGLGMQIGRLTETAQHHSEEIRHRGFRN